MRDTYMQFVVQNTTMYVIPKTNNAVYVSNIGQLLLGSLLVRLHFRYTMCSHRIERLKYVLHSRLLKYKTLGLACIFCMMSTNKTTVKQ